MSSAFDSAVRIAFSIAVTMAVGVGSFAIIRIVTAGSL